MNFQEWWDKEGSMIDPDFSDIPWFDKREELCAITWAAAQEAQSTEVADITRRYDQQVLVTDDLMESLDEAKYDEPELRSKLDKQRGEIERLTAEVAQLDEESERWCSRYLDANKESERLAGLVLDVSAAAVHIGNGEYAISGKIVKMCLDAATSEKPPATKEP